MDAVILAAGKGSRLDGIMAPYHKPLLVMQGKPLIRHAVENAMTARCSSVVVVAAPDNAAAISHVLNGPGMGAVDIIIQRTAMGPGHAINTALKLVRDEEMLVLMGDNFSPVSDVQRVVTHTGANVVTITSHHPDIAQNLTWIDNGTWVEKVRPSANVPCWVGPIKLRVNEFRAAYEQWCTKYQRAEILIGPLFNGLSSEVHTVTGSTIDIGTPEMMP